MKKIYWWIRIILLSLRWIPKFNIGDEVWYKNSRWILVQGVCAPTWTLQRGTKRINAHESKMRKVRLLSNYYHSFKSGYRFYMGYWYKIWVYEGIKPWMRGCNIWGKTKG